MQFYNSLNKSIHGRSQTATPLGQMSRSLSINHPTGAQPPAYSAIHKATPARTHSLSGYKNTSGYEPPTPWKDGQYSRDGGVAFPSTDSYTGYPSYMNDQYLQDMDCNGKYSTGSADSGVHSNSPIPRSHTPTDFTDLQLSPNHLLRASNHRASQQSLSKKTVKNETYV